MGKIELDHTGAGSGVTLSSDGTDLLLNGTAVGGAALELYAENPSSPTAPSATGTNAVAIGSGAIASGTSSIALATLSETTGNFAVAIGAGADALGTNAVGIKGEARYNQTTAIGKNSGTGNSIAGIAGNLTSNAAMALGGSYASGTDSFAAAIANNTSSYGATGANSVAIGQLAKATGADSVAIGDTAQATNVGAMAFGRDSIASGYTSLALGRLNVASGSSSLALGLQNDATIDRSHAIGYNAKAETRGKFAFAAGSWAFGKVANQGKAQHGLYVLLSDTTDATPDVMTGDNKAETGSANTTNQIILPNNSAYAFHGTIVARQQASTGTASAAWKIEGLIRREGSAGTTVLVNSATTVLDNTPAWGMALSADTTNGGLAITVTGAAATNIRWVATIHTSEVTY